ncbi:ArsS family sensor histidine kinase [Sulfurospirillum sp. 1612]|uniref:ArsS family sensor histidine kinase n=1 Tax=Sulfurospirillum sp. 1612 TaxID=3094835 RepID=UPI002F92E2A1
MDKLTKFWDMSLFKKVFILFCISMAIMFFLSSKTNQITNEKIALIYKNKYIESSKVFLDYMINGDMQGLAKRARELQYERRKIEHLQDKKVVYEHKVAFGDVKIFQTSEGYLLYMQYLDDQVLYYDQSQHNEIQQKAQLNYLIIADILLLIAIFLIFMRMLSPLKKISNAIEEFGSGDYSLRLPERKKHDEISKVVKKFNAMATNLEHLMESRNQLLRDISHELRTPISKALLSLEMMEEGKYKVILKRSIQQIDKLTNDLLEVERLNSDNLVLNLQIYPINSILAEALSKILIDDDADLQIDVPEPFSCEVDLNYIAIAIKNLIDNALKYRTHGKVEILVKNTSIAIKNFGIPLERDLEYYMQTFTQEESSRNIAGYGLGLNIVKRILEHHQLTLQYYHDRGQNVFIIKFHDI